MQTLMTRARRGTPLRWLARTLYTGAMLAAAAAAPIGAQETAPSPDAAAPATLTGVGSVETTSPTSLAVRTEDGSQQTFSVDDRSTVPPHLSRGQRVTVTYELTADGARRATTVSPVDSDAPSAAAADRLPPEPARTAEQKAGPPTVAVLGALAALAVGIGFALRAYTRTQRA
ncbi:MAG: hypothetical protein ABW221_02035 [Vicinamibacteria bacterium]